MKDATFTCALCGKIEQCQGEEDARAELDRNFPGAKVEDCARVCDACYVRLVGEE